MYVPHSGDMNFILEGSKAINAALGKSISQFIKMIKSITHKRKLVFRSGFRKLNLNNG